VTLITYLLSFAKRLSPTTSIGKANRDCVQPPIDQAQIEGMSQGSSPISTFETRHMKRKENRCPQKSSTTNRRALALSLTTALSSKIGITTENKNRRFSNQKENAWVYSSKGSPSSNYLLPMRVQQNCRQNITMKLPSHHDPLLNAFINSRI
jgi:hypothetical protein